MLPFFFCLNGGDKGGMKWSEELKERRILYGVKSKDISKITGIHAKTLSLIENGKREASSLLRELLERTVDMFNPEYEVFAIYDYIRIRFCDHNYQNLIKNVLKLNPNAFIKEDYGFYGYTGQYRFGDIAVLISDEENVRGTLFELKGKGCRFMEEILLTQERTWHNFFTDCLLNGGVFKRLDIAINDTAGLLSIPELAKKVNTVECDSIFGSFESIQSGGLSKQEQEDGKTAMGNTLYIGSKRSDIYFCVYEKDYEQFKKEGIPLEEAETRNRFEIRLKNDRAYAAIMNIMEFDDIRKTAFEIINRYVRFLEEDKNEKDIEKWNLDFRWHIFMHDCYYKLKLTMQPEPYTIERSYNWLSKSVAPTLAMVKKLDDIDGTDFVAQIENMALPEKQQKILEQYSRNVIDYILPGKGLEKEEMHKKRETLFRKNLELEKQNEKQAAEIERLKQLIKKKRG